MSREGIAVGGPLVSVGAGCLGTGVRVGAGRAGGGVAGVLFSARSEADISAIFLVRRLAWRSSKAARSSGVAGGAPGAVRPRRCHST